MQKQRFVFYISSLLHVLLVAFLGYFISLTVGVPPNLTIFFVVSFFALTSKLFSIMLGEDVKASRKTKIFSIIPFSLSIIVVFAKFSFFQILMAMVILVLYMVYPLLRGKIFLDIFHHTSRYAFLFLLAFGSINLDYIAFLTLLTIILFSMAGELISGLRREGKYQGTVSLLGFKKSLIFTAGLMVSGLLVSVYIFNGMFDFPIFVGNFSIPFYFIPSIILAYFLVKPLIKALKTGRMDVFYIVRKKEVMAIVVIFILFTFVWVGKTNLEIPVNSKNYSFNVEIRAFIVGKNTWDVPWILFDYVDENNYYYILLHKHGVLELARLVEGKREPYIASIQTSQTPFQTHKYHVFLNKTTITVILDGKYKLTAPRHPPATNPKIKISSEIPVFWFAYVGKLNIKQTSTF